MLNNIPLKRMIISIGIGFLVCLICLAILSAGIYSGKIPEVYITARGMTALGAFVCGMISASSAQKNKLLVALASGIIFYALLVLISAMLNQPWDNKTAGICFLLVIAGTILGGVLGTLTRKKIKNRNKRRSSK